MFGQHIHVGCASGDDAVYLTHMLARYIPHFIALSAASPFYQGEDTSFESSRLHAVSAFPLSGHMPFVRDPGPSSSRTSTRCAATASSRA